MEEERVQLEGVTVTAPAWRTSHLQAAPAPAGTAGGCALHRLGCWDPATSRIFWHWAGFAALFGLAASWPGCSAPGMWCRTCSWAVLRTWSWADPASLGVGRCWSLSLSPPCSLLPSYPHLALPCIPLCAPKPSSTFLPLLHLLTWARGSAERPRSSSCPREFGFGTALRFEPPIPPSQPLHAQDSRGTCPFLPAKPEHRFFEQSFHFI